MESQLERAGMPIIDYENSKEAIPETAIFKFVDAADKSEAWGEYSLEVTKSTRLEDGGLDEFLVSRASVWIALVNFCRFENQLSPTPPYWMQRDSELSWFCRGRHPLRIGARQIELFVVSRAVDVIRGLTHSEFCPPKVHLQTSDMGEIQQYPQFENADIRLKQPFTGVAIPHSLLVASTSRVGGGEFLYRARMAIAALEGSQIHRGIDRVAESLCMSRRSFQRHLSECNASYRMLYDEVVFDRTRSMLVQSHYTIQDISEALGFHDVANFTRSFTRITGVPPKFFTKLLDTDFD